MDVDPLITNLAQPKLFDLGDTSFGAVELFPSVWSAAEALTNSDETIRREGLERLAELNAARFSPLIAYLITTRLLDPNLEIRARVIRILAEVFAPDNQGQSAPDAVRLELKAWLCQMRTRQIYALLQAADFDPSSEPYISSLLNACPYAGNHLASILADRKVPLMIRKQAAVFTGRVGYLDAIPALERIATKLETRLNGQQAMPFAPVDGYDNEITLLPPVKEALTLLRSP